MRALTLDDFPAYSAGLAPRDRRPIYEWAAEHLTLPGSYTIPGKFDVSINRPLIAPLDAIADPTVRRVRFRKPPRFGGSLIADIAMPWAMVNDPGPMMANFPKQEFADERMREKLWPLWRSCRPFVDILPAGPGARFDITTTEIYFGDFFFVAQGIAPANLQGKGIRWQFNDETWLPAWQNLYGQAEARTRDFARLGCETVVDISQAGNAGDVEDRNYREGTQEVWGYLAPDGRHYPLLPGGKREDGTRWGLVWNADAKRKDGTISLARAVETARYRCRHTGHEWTDSARTRAEWNRDGTYLAQNPEAPPGVRSFAVNSLLNTPFAQLITRKIAAMKLADTGDMSALKDVKMQDECEPWHETFLTVEVASGAAGYKVADYADGKKVDDEARRTLTVDRQQGMRGDSPHRWCEVRAWRRDGSSRQLFYGRVDTKEGVRELQQRYGITDRCVWCDAQFEKSEVFNECAEYAWIACFGSNTDSWRHELPPADGRGDPVKVRLPFSPWQRTIASGRPVFYLHFSEDYCADILARLYSGRGAIRYEVPDDVLPEYSEQMKGEHKVLKRGRLTWEKLHSTKPNHAFDTGKMAVCFALLMKLIALPKKLDEKAGAAVAAAGGFDASAEA